MIITYLSFLVSIGFALLALYFQREELKIVRSRNDELLRQIDSLHQQGLAVDPPPTPMDATESSEIPAKVRDALEGFEDPEAQEEMTQEYLRYIETGVQPDEALAAVFSE